MQTASTRIWTQVPNSISYDNNLYADHTSINFKSIYVYIKSS